MASIKFTASRVVPLKVLPEKLSKIGTDPVFYNASNGSLNPGVQLGYCPFSVTVG